MTWYTVQWLANNLMNLVEDWQ